MTALWMQALLGGALIGLAAALLLVFNGRVMGASGIVNGLVDRVVVRDQAPEVGDQDWRVAFLVGLLAGAFLIDAAIGASAPRAGFPAWGLALAGLLVGFGTRLGSGCTSGHGVCGIARGSPRSIVATLVFMTTGVASVWLLRHATGVLP